MANIDFQNGYIAGLASRSKFVNRVVQSEIVSTKSSVTKVTNLVNSEVEEQVIHSTISAHTTAEVLESEE